MKYYLWKLNHFYNAHDVLTIGYIMVKSIFCMIFLLKNLKKKCMYGNHIIECSLTNNYNLTKSYDWTGIVFHISCL